MNSGTPRSILVYFTYFTESTTHFGCFGLSILEEWGDDTSWSNPTPTVAVFTQLLRFSPTFEILKKLAFFVSVANRAISVWCVRGLVARQTRAEKMPGVKFMHEFSRLPGLHRKHTGMRSDRL